MYFCIKNKKLNNKNLPVNPAKGGIPAIDKNIKIIVKDKKLFLLKFFRLFNDFSFLRSYKNNILKNKYSVNVYIYIFIYIIENP